MSDEIWSLNAILQYRFQEATKTIAIHSSSTSVAEAEGLLFFFSPTTMIMMTFKWIRVFKRATLHFHKDTFNYLDNQVPKFLKIRLSIFVSILWNLSIDLIFKVGWHKIATQKCKTLGSSFTNVITGFNFFLLRTPTKSAQK